MDHFVDTENEGVAPESTEVVKNNDSLIKIVKDRDIPGYDRKIGLDFSYPANNQALVMHSKS